MSAPMTEGSRWKWSVTVAVLALFVIVSSAPTAATGPRVARNVITDRRPLSRPSAAPAWSITPVVGPSNLRRLGLTIQHTSMGSTGHWGPSPDAFARLDDHAPPTADLTQSFTLTGADLYRLDCQACHKEDGSGVPPEINSLIEPVKGISLVLWQQRMTQAGRTIDPAFARRVVAGARADLLKRLMQGGQKMPPFAHLQGAEVQALVAYLELLAAVPGAAQRQRSVVESPVRVGEHLVKGTCHLCHDATGPWPSPEALLGNAVPSLAGLPRHRTLFEVVQKVRCGAPVVMGTARVAYRGRMPVFEYLTDGEVAAAYLYLIAYPPR
jgi:mono/diheme cytochrome c family protein